VNEQPVQLGDLAKDKITGFEGIVVCLSQYAFNSERLALRSRELDGGKPIDAQWFDTSTCEVVTPGVIEPIEPPPMPFELLATVRDTITGVEGKIIGFSTHITGCLRVALHSGRLTRDQAPVEEQWASVDQVELVSPPAAEETRAAPATRGGPMKAPGSQRDPRL
jgi:hypothetical protein